MKDFFNVSNYNVNYTISSYEKYIPLIITIVLVFLCYIFKWQLRTNKKLDKFLRYTMGIILTIFLSLYYILEWSVNGIQVYNLPLHICFISCILAIILCFNNSKAIYNFLIFAGVLGGLSSLLAPAYDLSFRYFRYYQFMICHSLIIVIPFYYFFVHQYKVSFKDYIKVLLQIEVLGIALGIFNEIYNTTYMFVSFTSNFAAKDSILYSLGTGYTYFIKLQLIFLVVMLLWYQLLKFLNSVLNKEI